MDAVVDGNTSIINWSENQQLPDIGDKRTLNQISAERDGKGQITVEYLSQGVLSDPDTAEDDPVLGTGNDVISVKEDPAAVGSDKVCTLECPSQALLIDCNKDPVVERGTDVAWVKTDPTAEGDDKVCTVRDSATILQASDGDKGLRESEVPKFCTLCDDATSTAEGYCQECAQDLCSACIHRHGKMKLAADHTIVLCPTSVCGEEDGTLTSDASLFQQQQADRLSQRTSTMDGVDRCRKHREEKLRFFCKNCQQPVCRDCILTAHKHHATDDISDATQAARSELASMMRNLQQKRNFLESHLSDLNEYNVNFIHQAEEVKVIMRKFHSEVTAVVEASFVELTEQLERLKQAEEERVHNLSVVVHNNLEDVNRLLSQQAQHTNSSIFVLSQHEIVSLALRTLDHSMQQMEVGGGEFFITKNLHLKNALEVENFLGTVAFMSHSSPPTKYQHSDLVNLHGKQSNAIPKTQIMEVSLHSEMTFNVWQTSGTKCSVRSIVETNSGGVWVAVPHILLKVAGVSRITNSIPVSEEIAGMAAGLGDKLLVSLGTGNVVRLYSSSSNWATFASIPKGSSIIASRYHGNSLQVYVAVTSATRATTKILLYSTDGQVCRQLKLPQKIFDTIPAVETWQNCSGSSTNITSSHHTSGLSLSCMAIGSDGELLLGSLAGEGHVLVVNTKGQLTGQYRGQDGSGCKPSSLCAAGQGKMIVADRHRSTVELVDLHGKFLATLLTSLHFPNGSTPTAVAVDSKDRLWVGTSMGNICAYSYLHAFQ